MESTRNFKFFLLTLSITSLAFGHKDESALSTIEKQATQIESQIQQLEDRIASFEEDGVHETASHEINNPSSDEAHSPSLVMAEDEKSFLLTQEPLNETGSQASSALEERSAFRVDLRQAFSGAPVIYSILAFLSMFSFSLWF